MMAPVPWNHITNPDGAFEPAPRDGRFVQGEIASREAAARNSSRAKIRIGSSKRIPRQSQLQRVIAARREVFESSVRTVTAARGWYRCVRGITRR